MTRLFLHVGYPKTGTSSLQHNLFEGHSGVSHVRRQDDILPIRREICNVEEATLEEARSKAHSAFKRRRRGRIVYSEEAYTEPLNARTSVDIGPLDIAHRLRTVFPPSNFDTKVVIVLRRQQDLLLSWYSFMYHSGFQQSPIESINHLIRTGVDDDLRYSRAFLEWMDFEEVLDAYIDSFGPKRVFAMAYEDFRQNQEAFLRRLCNVIEIDVQEALAIMERSAERNVSQSESGYYKPSRIHDILSQVKERYFPFLDTPRKHPFGDWIIETIRNAGSEPIEISDEAMELMKAYYGAKNARVEEKYGIDLEDRGYFVVR